MKQHPADPAPSKASAAKSAMAESLNTVIFGHYGRYVTATLYRSARPWSSSTKRHTRPARAASLLST